tara:strand:- start:1767 stop:2324 length:558 start_codon:yes stop_codon:yes gene_type:complete
MGAALRGAVALATKLGGVKGGLKVAHAGRKAGQVLSNSGIAGRAAEGIRQAIPRNMDDAALMIGPDILFGGLAGAMTPGDMGDKLIAGGMTAVGGAAGGIGMRGALGGIAPEAMKKHAYMQMGAELVGGLGGDMAGQGVADGLLRIKGGGQTPYEKMAADQQKQLEQDILRRYLSGKGGYPDELV